MEEIKSKVIQIISEQLGKDESEIQMNSHFIEDLDADGSGRRVRDRYTRRSSRKNQHSPICSRFYS